MSKAFRLVQNVQVLAKCALRICIGGEKNLKGDLNDGPNQVRVQQKVKFVFNDIAYWFVIQAYSCEDSGKNKKKWHPE